jgi:hypothetical protein
MLVYAQMPRFGEEMLNRDYDSWDSEIVTSNVRKLMLISLCNLKIIKYRVIVCTVIYGPL